MSSVLEFENPISDAISRVRFAPQSNNLLISSWDSNLRLYDVDSSTIRLEAPAEAALLDCCFQNESLAFSAGSDGSITRYDLQSGVNDKIGNHVDLATCVEYSGETSQMISAGWDMKVMSWDGRRAKALDCVAVLSAEVDSMSVCQYNLMVATENTVNIYDLRSLQRPLKMQESCVELPIKCISSVPDSSEGFAVGTVDGRVSLKLAGSPDSSSTGYIFRCRPKSELGKDYNVAVNDIVFNPWYVRFCSLIHKLEKLTNPFIISVRRVFVTGNADGYVAAWDSQSRKRLYELSRCSNSVASLSYNSTGQLLAVASSYSYTEAKEIEDPPEVHIYEANIPPV